MSKESKEVETIIGSTVKVEGDFKGEGDVVVEGIVCGKLKTKRNLSVGENAKISAAVEAANAIVAGEITGNIKIIESLELTSTAKVSGDIKTKILTVATGAQIDGNVKMAQSDVIKTENGEKTK